MRQNTNSGHINAKTMIQSSLLAVAGALACAVMIAAPAQAASNDTHFDVCAALRSGTSLASIETILKADGYSASNAGTLTGTTIRQQCPDQAARVLAQIHRAGA